MTNIDERAEFETFARKHLRKDGPFLRECGLIDSPFTYADPDIEGAWQDWRQARATLPTAEAPEYEVVRIMAEGMEPTYSDTYSSRELIEKAIRALSNNGYKVVRKS
jgi:hypothetical protein